MKSKLSEPVTDAVELGKEAPLIKKQVRIQEPEELEPEKMPDPQVQDAAFVTANDDTQEEQKQQEQQDVQPV